MLLAVIVALSGCASDAAGSSDELRLGYFPNLTHAIAIAGMEGGFFEDALGSTRLVPKAFAAGPAAVEALFSGALDASYMGPSPAVNAFVQSRGKAVRVVAGAASGGAALVVRRSIDGPEALRGTRVASPQLGGTQDVALRSWLRGHGLATNPAGGGDVSILPQDNAQTLEAFRSGQVDGAWVPEPWVTRMVHEAGGRILVDERDLWPDRAFATTVLVVRTEFLRRHPGVVRRLLEGQVRTTRFLNGDGEAARGMVNEGLRKATGKRLGDSVMRDAWKNLAFTTDPVPGSISVAAERAAAAGLLRGGDLDGIFDLRMLNDVLRDHDEREVPS